MTYEEMGLLQEKVFEQIREIRMTKGREYAQDADTLADFKEVAEACGVTPMQCWSVYTQKHLRAIDAFVREGAVKSESIEGRVLDVIVYHLLLLGLVRDLQKVEPGEVDLDYLDHDGFAGADDRDDNERAVTRSERF